MKGNPRETLKDALNIAENIINSEIYTEGKSKGISLLEAAQKFNSQDFENSDLKKILGNLVKYPEGTQVLLQELDLLLEDLK